MGNHEAAIADFDKAIIHESEYKDSANQKKSEIATLLHQNRAVGNLSEPKIQIRPWPHSSTFSNKRKTIDLTETPKGPKTDSVKKQKTQDTGIYGFPRGFLLDKEKEKKNSAQQENEKQSVSLNQRSSFSPNT
jgi:hypothetical protein